MSVGPALCAGPADMEISASKFDLGRRFGSGPVVCGCSGGQVRFPCSAKSGGRALQEVVQMGVGA
jgi:hypothetical protein